MVDLGNWILNQGICTVVDELNQRVIVEGEYLFNLSIIQSVPKLPSMEVLLWSDRKAVCIFVTTVVENGGPAPF